MLSLSRRLALCVFLFSTTSQSDIISQDIRAWINPRAALIRNDIYFQGGLLKLGKFRDGKWEELNNTPTVDVIHRLSLNEAFEVGGNNPPVFRAVYSKLSNSPTPWRSGYMFADYDELYTYGHVFRALGSAMNPDQAAYRTISYPLYDPPPGMADDANYFRVPSDQYTPPDLAYKITNGAGASAPSEQLGFYFGGMNSKTMGNVAQAGFNDREDLVPSDVLLKVDMTEQGAAQWTPIPQGNSVTPRADGGLVWIPAGEQGMLIAIGGTINDTSLYASRQRKNNWERNNNFTQEISVFDIKNQMWFKQSIPDDSGKPTRLMQFCAVALTHGKGREKHHDIYIVGGRTDNTTESVTGDVWVLSIPSFKWIPLDVAGQKSVPRVAHTCFLPNPNKILVIGGAGASENDLTAPSAVDVFDISKLSWTGAYDPTEDVEYTPPDSVLNRDVVDSWPEGMDDRLKEYLNTTYDPAGEKLRTFWPYRLEGGSIDNSTERDPEEDKLPGYVVPVAATLSSVGGVSIIALLIFCCIRRRRQQPDSRHRHSTTTTGTTGHGWIDRWRHKAAKDVASDTITETDGAVSPQPQPAMSETTYRNSLTQPSELESAGYFRNSRPPIYEIDSSTLHEVHGRSSPGHFHEELDPRRFPMYPPSVVSGGHYSHSATGGGDDSSVSHPTASPAGITPSSPTASRSSPLGMAPIASIPEAAAFSLNGHSAADGDTQQQQQEEGLTREASQRAVSPLASDSGAGGLPRRPGHRRHNSSMSSGLSPFPSPGMGNGFNEGDEDEDEGMRRDGGNGSTI